MIFHSKIPVGVLIQTFLRAIKIDQGLWPFPRHKYCRVKSLHCPGVEKVGDDHRFVPLMARKYERYLWTWIFMVHPRPSTTTIWGWYSTLIDGNIGDWFTIGFTTLFSVTQFLHHDGWLWCQAKRKNCSLGDFHSLSFQHQNCEISRRQWVSHLEPESVIPRLDIVTPYYPYPNQIMNLHGNRNQMGWFGPLSSSCSPVKNLGP